MPRRPGVAGGAPPGRGRTGTPGPAADQPGPPGDTPGCSPPSGRSPWSSWARGEGELGDLAHGVTPAVGEQREHLPLLEAAPLLPQRRGDPGHDPTLRVAQQVQELPFGRL